MLSFITALAVAALQLLLFLPPVSSGRGVDLGPFRADGVALVYGTTWALALALASLRVSDRRQAASSLLLLAGLLSVAYAREPLLLYLGWEIATAGLWLAQPGKVRLDPTAATMHLAGVPLLAAILLGLLTPFAPPLGGAAEPWHPAIVLILAAVVLLRIWLALLTISPVTRHWLFAMAAPMLLVKALVAAPFDPFGIWLLALLGTSMALLGAWFRIAPGASRHMQAFGLVWTGCVVAALGLATGTPLAAAGAVWLMLVGSVMATTIGQLRIDVGTGRTTSVLMVAALPGIWLITQGALDLRYGLIATLLLPCLLVALQRENSNKVGSSRINSDYQLPTLIVALALAVAVYPQLPIELAVRPAVQAMAGGVGALITLAGDWGVGLMVRPAQVGLSAGLPATGMMVALFLAFVTLYWLRRLVRWLSRHPEGTKAE